MKPPYPDILIATCKKQAEILSMVSIVKSICRGNVIATCMSVSASVNRNCALEMAKSDIVIMIDDDIEGFYDGWDIDLIQPLFDSDDVRFVSARLVDRAGNVGNMVCNPTDLSSSVVDVKFAPTACCAFRRSSLRFFEEYRGSGFEDTDYIVQLRRMFGEKNCRVVINNECRMIHINEMKKQYCNFQYNRDVFFKRWGFEP